MVTWSWVWFLRSPQLGVWAVTAFGEHRFTGAAADGARAGYPWDAICAYGAAGLIFFSALGASRVLSRFVPNTTDRLVPE